MTTSPRDADPEQITDAEDVAAMLTSLRLASGLTVRQVARAIGQPNSTVGGWFSGRHLPPTSRQDVTRDLLNALGVPSGHHESWITAIQEVHRRKRVAPGDSPFRGLSAYESDDAEIFFGRDDLVLELVDLTEAIIDRRATLPAIVVVGPSGAGKSSVVRAGLIPALREPGESAPEDWSTSVTTPGRHPLGALRDALEQLDRRGPQLLVVDQFEELWTQHVPPGHRDAFVFGVLDWARTEQAQRVVVLVVRADHYGHLSEYEDLVPVVRRNQVLVGPMTTAQIREVITGPARTRGLAIEDGLVDVLVEAGDGHRSAGGRTGSLPHLSHTLAAMWERSDRRRLTLADYQAVGGLEGAIAQSAETAYASLTAAERQAARHLLLRMVTLDAGGGTSRRRLHQEEVEALLSPATPAGSGEVMRDVLQRLAAARLVTVGADTVELSHEALIWAWPRLAQWIAETRATLPGREVLARETREWITSGHDHSHLLRGSRLEVARGWAEENHLDLTDDERSFLEASAVHEERIRRREHRQRLRMRRFLVAVSILSVLSLALAGVSAFAWHRADTAKSAALSRQLAIISGTLRDGHLPASGQLAAAAYDAAQTLEARSALLDATSAPTVTRRLSPGGVHSLATSPDGTLLAVGRDKGGLDLVRLSGGTMTTLSTVPLPHVTDGTESLTVQKVEFGPSGTVIAAVGNETLQLVDVTDPAHPAVTHTQVPGAGSLLDLAFTPDGRHLFIGTAEAGIARIDLDRATVVRQRAPDTTLSGSIHTLQLSPDGSVLIAGTDSSDVSTWTVHGADLTPADHVTGGTTDSLFTSAFSPDGSTVALAGKAHAVRIYPIDGRGRLGTPTRLTNFGSWVNEVAFSRDGNTLATGSSDNTLKLWRRDGTLLEDVPLGAAVATVAPAGTESWVASTTDAKTYLIGARGPVLPAMGDSVFAIRFDASGNRMVTAPGTDDARLHLWDTSDLLAPREIGTLRAPRDAGLLDGCAAITADGTRVASGTETGSVLVWDVADPRSPELLADLKVSDLLIEQLTFTADGTRLVVGGDDGHARVIDLSEPGHARVVEDHDAGTPVMNVAVSRSGLLAAAGITGATALWKDGAPAEQPTATVRADTTAMGVAFDPGGTRLAVGSADTFLHLWDVSDPARPTVIGAPLTGPGNTVFSVAFSPDGRMVAGAVKDGTVWVWRRTGDGTFQRYAVLRAAQVPLLSVAWSPDGRVLAAGGYEGMTRMWLVHPDDARARVCSSSGDALTAQEWSALAPGATFTHPCS